MRRDLVGVVIGIAGFGYVGLPLARAFARGFKVVGYAPLLTENEIEFGTRVKELSETPKVDAIRVGFHYRSL